jgi:hypothetical protein
MVLRAEPGKQRPRSCRTQELARSSAQENERQKKVAGYHTQWNWREKADPVSNDGGERVKSQTCLDGS